MLSDILRSIVAIGGKPFEVGGCVRDRLLAAQVKDIDIEVFHLDPAQLTDVLRRFGRVDQVGVSFGVIKLNTRDGAEYDFTLPRRESKSGRGHRGFQVQVDHTMTVEEAAARRDFTINAIYRCPLEDRILDPYGGVADLNNRVLRATSEHFAEDPLRVLRGLQFAARFGMTIDSRTVELCRSLFAESRELVVERVWAEWHKWALRGSHPSHGLRVLQQAGWLSLYPELAALPGVPQDPQWHPEGDVWVHTLHVCDAAARIADRDELDEHDRIVLLFAALCHDLGKATTTEFFDGHWRAHGHCEAGVPLTRAFLERIGCPERYIEVVEPLVAEHLVHARRDMSPRIVRRLAHRLDKATVAQLVRLIEADVNGRPPLPGGVPETAREMVRIAESLDLQQNKPRPILMGRHLIQLGHPPGRWFGELLGYCFEAQLDGAFHDEETALLFLHQHLATHGIPRDRPHDTHDVT